MSWRIHLGIAASAACVSIVLYVALGCARKDAPTAQPAAQKGAAPAGQSPAAASCTKDQECPRERICKDGRCVPIR